MSKGMGSMSSDRPQSSFSELNLKLVLRSLWPFLAEFKVRIIVALLLLFTAKGASVLMPWLLKNIVDGVNAGAASELSAASVNAIEVVSVPLAFLFAYGFARFMMVVLAELRDSLFGRVTERAMRRIGLDIFKHLHALDLSFHLSRQTGGLSRDIERGTTGISTLMRFMIFNIVPTLIEITLVVVILTVSFSWIYAALTLGAVAFYLVFTVITTEWRTRFVREAHQADNASNTRAIDSLLNYETVKYFNSEAFEAKLYDQNLAKWEKARMKNRLSLAALNSGQSFIVSLAVMSIMIMASYQVVAGEITVGELVMINAYMLQLFIPLNFLGFVYREIRRALTEIENLFKLKALKSKVVDKPEAKDIQVSEAKIRFKNIGFHYQASRPILKNVSFDIKSGEKVAIVGSSGAGKSTLARLLFRFYEVNSGAIEIDGQDIRDVNQLSLRQQIGVVPQDTVLFNDSIRNNIAYGIEDIRDEDILRVIELAKLSRFIDSLPDGWHTQVGERGLKVSGGEKQRIAIARVLLKNPKILIFDEATSSLDSDAERVVNQSLSELSQSHSSLVIAHRLSTIIDADNIVVLEAGEVVEQGTHIELLNAEGRYAYLWSLQKQAQQQQEK